MNDIEIPDLIDLPVYRDTYLSQERTDELCSLIWKEQPDLIERFVDNAQRRTFPNDRDIFFSKPNTSMIVHLREKEKVGEIKPISMTGMVDFMYEMDRRIRKITGKPEVEALSEPIASGPNGPYPEMQNVPIYRNKEGHPNRGMTQEIADRLCPQIYDYILKNNPEVIFAYFELNRRQFRLGEPTGVLSGIVRDFVKSSGEDITINRMRTEFIRRIALSNSQQQLSDEVLNND